MSACAKSRAKPPIDPCKFRARATIWKVQRKLHTTAEGATVNDRNESDSKDAGNWSTVGEAYFYVRPRRGRLSEVADLQIEETTGDAIAKWDALTGTIDSDYRLAKNIGESDEKIYRVHGAVDWEEGDEWVVLQVAKFSKTEEA